MASSLFAIRVALAIACVGFAIACGGVTTGPDVAPSNPSDDASAPGMGDASFGFLADGGVAGFSALIEDAADGVTTTATLTCADDCVDLTAVAQGGLTPYTYTWSDGVKGATRHLCESATMSFVLSLAVTVADAGVTGEFSRPPLSTQATLTVRVEGCPDAGADTDGAPPAGCGASSNPVVPSSPPPSCAPGGPGMTDCGASLESCCAVDDVAGGTYSRTYTNAGNGPTGEADPATVSCFGLDKYLVTMGRFRQFVSAWKSGYRPPPGSGKHAHLNGGLGLANSGDPGTYEAGWNALDDGNLAPTDANLACANGATWTASPGSSETLPVACANWWEAAAFCIWDGGFLPSEAEWEYAAAGGSQQREYPWGSTDPGTGTQYAVYATPYDLTPAPVGTATLGAGRWGQLDLAGELTGWMADSFTDYVNPCVDCADLTNTNLRSERGGLLGDPKADLVAAFRDNTTPASRNYGVGIRCARAP